MLQAQSTLTAAKCRCCRPAGQVDVDVAGELQVKLRQLAESREACVQHRFSGDQPSGSSLSPPRPVGDRARRPRSICSPLYSEALAPELETAAAAAEANGTRGERELYRPVSMSLLESSQAARQGETSSPHVPVNPRPASGLRRTESGRFLRTGYRFSSHRWAASPVKGAALKEKVQEQEQEQESDLKTQSSKVLFKSLRRSLSLRLRKGPELRRESGEGEGEGVSSRVRTQSVSNAFIQGLQPRGRTGSPTQATAPKANSTPSPKGNTEESSWWRILTAHFRKKPLGTKEPQKPHRLRPEGQSNGWTSPTLGMNLNLSRSRCRSGESIADVGENHHHEAGSEVPSPSSEGKLCCLCGAGV